MDGLHGRNPSWSSDGRSIAYVHQPFNLDKISYPIIRIINEQSMEVTKIGSGDFPTWSPDGKRLAYSDNFLKVLDIESGTCSEFDIFKEVHPFQGYPRGTQYSWSPIDNQIMLIDDSHRLIILDIQSMTARWIPKIRARIAGWAPDGKEIAFIGEIVEELIDDDNILIASERKDLEHEVHHTD